MEKLYDIIENDTIFFDIETTGLDIKSDRIIEICAIKYRTDKTKISFHKYFNPGVEISEEAENIHGLTNEMLSEYPSFAECIDELYDFFNGCDLGGYNCSNFDIPFLFEEFSRNGKSINFFKCNVLDSFTLLNTFESRKLQDVYKRFFGGDIDSHEADSDIEATIEIFEEQVERYGLEGKSSKEISQMTKNGKIDFSGWFKKHEDGYIYYNKGKYRGKPVDCDLSYLSWLVNESNIENDSKLAGNLIYKRLVNVQ